MKEFALNKEKYIENYNSLQNLNANLTTFENFNFNNLSQNSTQRKSSNLDDNDHNNHSMIVECDDHDFRNDNIEHTENIFQCHN